VKKSGRDNPPFYYFRWQSLIIGDTWRACDWPDDHYSTLTITLSPVSSKTKLSFVQTGVPEDQYKEISHGWYDYYRDPL
jgi:activator of HSP90 ATPase